MKKLIFFFCILFLLAPFINAQPPVNILFYGDFGLNIQASPPRFLEPGTHGEATLHVFNVTNGVLMTNESPSLVECTALVQWPNGTELAILSATPDGDHYDFTLDLSNVHELGAYGWVMYCNNTWQGGYTSGFFELTPTGNENLSKDNSSGIAIVIFILAISGSLFLLSMKKDLLKNKYTNIIARRSFLVLGIYLMILNSAIMATLAASSNIPVVNDLFIYMYLFGYAGYPTMILLVVSALFQALRDMKQDKREKRTGEEEDE